MPDFADETYATRATLLARLKDWQDGASWQDFFDTYWKLIFGVARKRGLSEAEAEDVVQETMLSVAKHMPAFHYDPVQGSFKVWLLNLTRWRITDQFRKRGPVGVPPASGEAPAEMPELENMVDEAGSEEELARIWEEEWRMNLLQIATHRVKVRLAPEKYQIFDFLVNKGWASERVAAAFRIPVAQVHLAKHRITRLLKKEIEQLEVDLDRNGAAEAPSARGGLDDPGTEGLEDRAGEG